MSDNNKDVAYNQLLKKICELGIGRILPNDMPYVSLPPKPYVINNAARIMSDGVQKHSILKNLSNIVIYLGGDTEPNEWYRQAIYPLNSKTSLSSTSFSSMISQLRYLEGVDLKIVVSNKMEDSFVECMRLSGIDNLSVVFNPYSLYLNQGILKEIKSKGWQIVLSISPKDIAQYENCEIPTTIKQIVSSCIFLVNDEESLSIAETYEQTFLPARCSFVPVWDNNYDFFKGHILLSKDEILESSLMKRQIHIHQLVNMNYWGCIVITPDGRVFADVNDVSIGDISHTLPKLVENELRLNTSWRRVRDYEPCSNCLFQWLCPSPSPFEKLTGQLICNK